MGTHPNDAVGQVAYHNMLTVAEGFSLPLYMATIGWKPEGFRYGVIQ